MTLSPSIAKGQWVEPIPIQLVSFQPSKSNSPPVTRPWFPLGRGQASASGSEMGAGGRSVCAWRNHGFPARLGRPANAVAPLHQSDQGGGDASDFRSLRMW